MNITPEQKKRRFRQLTRHDQIRTGRQLAEELEQPYLPLMDVTARSYGAPVRGRRAKYRIGGHDD
jgi:hypothetical protein